MTGRARATDPATSHTAAALIEPALRPEQARCMDLLRAMGQATAHEITLALYRQDIDRDQNCVAKRLSELRDLGLIEDTGMTRPGRSRRPLIVWRPTEQQLALFGEAS